MRRALDWAGTIAFLPVFLAILLVFDVLLRLVTPFGQRAIQRVAIALQIALVWAYRLAGMSVDLERSPRIVPGKPFIVISNHQSMFDIPLFAWAMPDCLPKYISKRELGRWLPAVSYNLRRGGHALIDRKDRAGSVEAIRQLARNAVAHGWAAVIFPEGTRARGGEIGVFKPAGALALMEEAREVPIVPACLDQSWRVMMHRMAPIPFGIRLRLWIGDPIERRPGDDPEQILHDVEQIIRERLARSRGESTQAAPARASA